jgi:hypothetical protein
VSVAFAVGEFPLGLGNLNTFGGSQIGVTATWTKSMACATISAPMW